MVRNAARGYGMAMKLIRNALLRLRHPVITPVAAAAVLALGLQTATAAPAKVAVQPPKPSSDVIPLPLNPVVPAGQRLCSATTPSGLGVMQLKPAEAAKPARADYVLVNYLGFLAANGEVFDQNMQAAFPVDGVIPGFSEGLQMMTKGSIWRFCVPAALGYGDQVSGPIPAGSDLVFQVELLDFKSPAELEAMRAAQQAADPAPAAQK
ncbi:MAG: FKBP-type peptidyl-prolyl cis-trans isomerase [Novosphingobium meiothermophilum]